VSQLQLENYIARPEKEFSLLATHSVIDDLSIISKFFCHYARNHECCPYIPAYFNELTTRFIVTVPQTNISVSMG